MNESGDNRIQLFIGPLNMFGIKTWIAALEKGIDCTVVMVQYNESTGYHPKHPEVLRVNPKGQVPILVHGDLELFDSTQIFEYFEDLRPQPPLWPTDLRARARARRLELECDEVFFPHVIQLMGLQDALDGHEAARTCDAIRHYYALMEKQLADHAFLCGETVAYPDIAFYMAQLFAERMGATLPASEPNMFQWRKRMSSRSSVQTALTPLVEYLNANNRPIPAMLDYIQPWLSESRT